MKTKSKTKTKTKRKRKSLKPLKWDFTAGKKKKLTVVDANDDLYALEDIEYHRAVTEARYQKTLKSLLQQGSMPGKAITVPIGDIKHLSPHGFASGAKKLMQEHPVLRNYDIRTKILKVTTGSGKNASDKVYGVRFYRIK